MSTRSSPLRQSDLQIFDVTVNTLLKAFQPALACAGLR